MSTKDLRDEYFKLSGKNPFPGWTKDQLLKRIDNLKRPDSEKIPEEELLESEKEDRLIMIPKSELQEMIDEATRKALSSQPETPDFTDWREWTPPKDKNKTATLKLYQEAGDKPVGVVTRVEYLKTVWNEEEHKFNKVLYAMEVTYDDKSVKNYEIDVREYAKLNRIEKVELIDVDRKILKKSTGKTMLNLPNNKGIMMRNANSGSYGVSLGGEYEVDLNVFRVDETFTVLRPNGQKLKIHSKYLNT
jgi:hypothetical protein